MQVTKLSWHQYRIPFVRPFATAHGQMLHREGLLVKVEAAGLEGWGEIAPLPDFGEGGSLPNVLALLQMIGPQLVVGAVEDWLDGQLDILIAKACATSKLEITGQERSVVCFGLELAAYDLLARAQKLPLAVYWGATLTPLAVNGTVGTSSSEGAVAAAQSLAQSGFSCIKLKVGMASSEVAEISRIAAVRKALDTLAQTQQLGQIKLRLDANEAWTVSQAINILKQVAQYDLELVEQPVLAADIRGLAQVQRETGLTIAADEAVNSLAAVHAIIQAQAAQVLVIKPATVGGVRAAREIIRLSEKAGLRSLITTTLDTGVGIAGALHLALTLASPALACGLATAGLLESTLLKTPLLLQNGWMSASNQAGLGIKLAPTELEHYQSGNEWSQGVFLGKT